MAKKQHHELLWQLTLAISFITLSILLYVLHALIFNDIYHIFYYLLLDIAFIPINLLIVTLIQVVGVVETVNRIS